MIIKSSVRKTMNACFMSCICFVLSYYMNIKREEICIKHHSYVGDVSYSVSSQVQSPLSVNVSRIAQGPFKI